MVGIIFVGNMSPASAASASCGVADPGLTVVSGKMIIDGKVTPKFEHAHSLDFYLAWIDAMY